jgi:hypothetical protein
MMADLQQGGDTTGTNFTTSTVDPRTNKRMYSIVCAFA